MELVYALLATHAQVNNGKLTLFDGDWDSLQVSGLPGVVPPFAVVAKIRFTPDEVGQPHTFRLAVISPTGQVSGPEEPNDLPLTRNPHDPTSPSNTLVVAMLATGFEVEGGYGISVLVDEREIVRLPLTVTVAQRPNR